MSKKTDIAQKYGIEDAPPVTDIDTAVINSGPAVFANKIYASTAAHGMRLTFAEVNPAAEVPSYRTAVFLGFHEVAGLADLLQRQLALVEFVEYKEAAGKSGDTT